MYDRRGNEIDYTRDYPIFKDAEGNTKQFPEKISTRGEYTALNETVYQNTSTGRVIAWWAWQLRFGSDSYLFLILWWKF